MPDWAIDQMRYLIVIIYALLLVSCGEGTTNNIFDGNRICIDSKNFINLKVKAGSDDYGFDKNRDRLIVHYDESNQFFAELVSLYGPPIGNYNLIWISISPLTEIEVQRYENHSMTSDAFYLRNSYKWGKKEVLDNGFIKAYRGSEKDYSWQIFQNEERLKNYDQANWMGGCRRFSDYTKCRYFSIFDNKYLVEIKFPENFLWHSKEVSQRVFKNIEEEVFCEKEN